MKAKQSVSGQAKKSALSCCPFGNYWFESISPYPLAAFRILFGVYLFCYFAQFIFRVEMLFSSNGVYVPFAMPDYAPAPLLAWLIYLLTLGLCALFILGFRTRIITPFLLLYYLYHYFLNLSLPNYSYDKINMQFLFLLCFAELDLVWSLSPSRKVVGTLEPTTPAWATRFIVLQVFFQYFGSGLWKLFNPVWHSGSIISLTYAGPWGTDLAFAVLQLGLADWFYDVVTWGVILFELVFGFVLYSRKFQRFAIVLGILFHLHNWAFLQIFEFFSLVSAYVLFIEGAEVKRLGERIFSAFVSRKPS